MPARAATAITRPPVTSAALAPASSMSRPITGGPTRPQPVLRLRHTPRTRPRMCGGGSVWRTVVPAVSETDSTTAMGMTSRISSARVGVSPAAI